MEIEQITRIIRDWAENEKRVRQAYIFGSRAQGTNSPDSNIDVAVRIHKASDEATEFLAWLHVGDELREALQKRLTYQVDMQWYDDAASPTIYRDIFKSSRLIYQERTSAENLESV